MLHGAWGGQRELKGEGDSEWEAESWRALHYDAGNLDSVSCGGMEIKVSLEESSVQLKILQPVWKRPLECFVTFNQMRVEKDAWKSDIVSMY